ncbi:MAG: YqaA family protein [Sphingomonadaceae bacterium]
MLRRLYEWTLARAAHPRAERWLAFISFIESSFFPIPPDVLLAPMCLASKEKCFRFAFVTTAFSVLGGLLGYLIGLSLFDTIGEWIIVAYGLQHEFGEFAEAFNEQGAIIVFLAALTPLPFKVITIAAGATQMPLLALVAASIVGRGARFYLVALLLWKFGPPMKRLIDRHFGLVTTAFGLLAVGGFIAVKYLV